MKNNRTTLLIISCFICALTYTAHAQQGFVHGRSSSYEWPTEENVLQKLDKWQDMKFGVLLHWGLYSVPGIVESWSICSEDEDWIPRDTTMEYNAYKQWYWGLKDKFNPTQFGPAQWARTIKAAGMKYAIFTTKHHDGFCMFDTRETDFSIAHGAFGKDARKDVARHVFDAFRNEGLMTGAYFSKPDWHSKYYWWPYFATPNRNVNYKIQKHPERWAKFQQYTYNQISELMHNYGPLDILWLDGGWVAAPKQDIKMDKIARMAREAQPGLLIVDRTIHGKYENYQTPERAIPETQLPYPWESCITLSNDWGWVPNAKFKSPETVIANLIEIVAKGGCLLLGVGPTPEGIIEEEVVKRLQKVGAWLDVNGEAIYNTRITPCYHSGNTWFTESKDKQKTYALYALRDGENIPEIIEWEGNLPASHTKMILLQTGKKVKYTCEGNKVKVYLPKGTVKRNESLAFAYHK